MAKAKPASGCRNDSARPDHCSFREPSGTRPLRLSASSSGRVARARRHAEQPSFRRGHPSPLAPANALRERKCSPLPQKWEKVPRAGGEASVVPLRRIDRPVKAECLRSSPRPCGLGGCKCRAILYRSLTRGGAVWQLVGLITRRSKVQILPPQPNKSSTCLTKSRPPRRLFVLWPISAGEVPLRPRPRGRP
jgi:hypothetical protein